MVRVWSTHWWVDQRGALDRLVDALELTLVEARERARVDADRLAKPFPPTDAAPINVDVVAETP